MPQFCPLEQHVTCLSMTGHPGEIRTLSPKGLETILGPMGKSRILAQESRHGPTSSGDLDLIIFFLFKMETHKIINYGTKRMVSVIINRLRYAGGSD